MSPDRKPIKGKKLTGAVVVFFFSAFLLLTLKNPTPLSIMMMVLVPGIFYAATELIPRLFPADRLMLSMVNFLCALGVLVLYRMNPQQGLNQAVNYGVGAVAMLFCIVLVRVIHHWRPVIAVVAVGSLVLMALPVLFGTERNGAKAWISLLGVSFQPSELVKLALLLVTSFLLARRKVLASAAFAGGCLLLLMLQKDLGTALIYYGTFMVIVFAATRNYFYLGMGALGAAAGSVLGYQMFGHVRRRVSIWLDPWYDYSGAGYQIVQSLIAMVNGGVWGMGLGLGNAYDIPESTTDFVFSIILNEFGLLFGVCVIGIYVLLFLRGISVSLRANSRFHALLAAGAAAMIALQTFIIIGGNIKMIPLTGITLPFISFGGTSLLSSMCVMGLLQGVASINDDDILADRELALMQEEYA